MQAVASPHSCGLCRIELQNVEVSLEQEMLLRDINVHIHCGQLTVLIGPNGGGKTTLLRAMLGLVPYAGRILHLDEHDKPFSGLKTGYVPQQLPFDKQMPVTVRDLLAAALSRRPVWTGVSRKTRNRALQALGMAQATPLIDRRLGALSGGELQRVLLALALNPTPDLLILDEPVSGVDHNGQALFLDTVDALRKQQHMAILLVSHDWMLVQEYADQVILIDKTVRAIGTADAVFASPAFAEVFPHSHGAGRMA